jgi:hypothetical protein
MIFPVYFAHKPSRIVARIIRIETSVIGGIPDLRIISVHTNEIPQKTLAKMI